MESDGIDSHVRAQGKGVKNKKLKHLDMTFVLFLQKNNNAVGTEFKDSFHFNIRKID